MIMHRKTGRHRIYMNVGYILCEDQLHRYFSRFGNVLDVYLPRHKSGRNKGFGFTTFETEEELNLSLQRAEHIVDGVVVKINKAGPRPEYEQPPPDPLKPLGQGLDGAVCKGASMAGSLASRAGSAAGPVSPTAGGGQGQGPRLYVGGVPDEISEEQIVEHFGRWGNVVDVYFPGKKGAKRVNYCFVTFDNWRSAQRACNQSERNILGQPLQSISMAEERQGEARADPCNLGGAPPAAAGVPYHGGLGGAAAHAQEANLTGLGGLNPVTLAALAAGSLQLPRAGLGGYSALAALQGMAAPAPVPPANGFAALQSLLATGLLTPASLQTLVTALAAANTQATAAAAPNGSLNDILHGAPAGHGSGLGMGGAGQLGTSSVAGRYLAGLGSAGQGSCGVSQGAGLAGSANKTNGGMLQERWPLAFPLGAHGGLGSPPPQQVIKPDPAAPPLTPAQQAEMQRILLLHSGQAGGQLGDLGLGSLGSALGSAGSGSDPLAAVYANVNRNFSPGDASLLSPWGLQQQQQQQAAAAAHQQAAAAAEENVKVGVGGISALVERVQYPPQVRVRSPIKMDSGPGAAPGASAAPPPADMTMDGAAAKTGLKDDATESPIAAGTALQGLLDGSLANNLAAVEDSIRADAAEGLLPPLTGLCLAHHNAPVAPATMAGFHAGLMSSSDPTWGGPVPGMAPGAPASMQG